MDTARQLFEELRAGGYERLVQMKGEHYQEGLYIDFKLLAAGEAPMKTDDKRIYAEAVSGFANSDGGVVVWGVRAAKGAEGVDCVQGFQPIKRLRRFLSDLNTQLAQLVAPGGVAVEHFLVDMPDQDDCGFAATLVPRWDGLPQMAKGQGQHRYYYRSGDSFLIMEPFMLADRFGRRPQPKLELIHRWERSMNQAYLVLGIKNVGRGMALYPALEIEERGPQDFPLFALDERFAIPGDQRAFGLPERVRTTQRPAVCWRMFAGGHEHVIHPGSSIEVVRALGRIMPTQRDNVDWRDVSFRYSLFCEGFTLIEDIKAISAEEVCNAAIGGY